MNGFRYLKNVTTLRFNPERCNGCRLCLQVCPHGVLEPAEKRIKIGDADACMECGACARNCPTQALQVKAGVGCAGALLTGWFYRTEPTCDCACRSAAPVKTK
ncbi:MAG: mercury methylation ferredoxin HgcB [candidate division FCPU426 bacterium]